MKFTSIGLRRPVTETGVEDFTEAGWGVAQKDARCDKQIACACIA
jgi:hypothetical protein